MSRIVALRDAIQDRLREEIPDLAHVDWHDGAFDDDDVRDLTSRTPAAYVTLLSVPSDQQLSTREMNADVRVFVNIVTSDSDFREERGSDPAVWLLMEQVATLANLNTWGVPGCAPANGVRFKRLRDPTLRREGVAVGCVEWSNGLKIGIDVATAREFPLGPNTTLAEAGLTFVGEGRRLRAPEDPPEILDLTVPPDDPRRLEHEIY